MWILAAIGGCADTKDIEVVVNQEDGTPTLSWDIGDATLVTVNRCEEGCECAYTAPLVGAQQTLTGGTDLMWQVGFSHDAVGDDEDIISEVLADPGLVESPLKYGEEVPRDLLEYEAVPLESGVRYGVVVNIFGPCDPSESTCWHTDASGCFLFEAN